jgi:hypothetical protein
MLAAALRKTNFKTTLAVGHHEIMDRQFWAGLKMQFGRAYRTPKHWTRG